MHTHQLLSYFPHNSMSWASLYLQRKKPGVREVKQFAKRQKEANTAFRVQSGMRSVVITALLQRRMPRCWEVGVCGHTASWGRAGSQQTWCLPPSRPHGPLPGTEGPSPGKETPWLGASPLCGSKLPILPPGSAGLCSGAWSSPGDPDVPLQGPRRAEGLQTPRGRRLVSARVPTSGAARGRLDTVQGPPARPRQDAPSAASLEPGPGRPSQTPSMGAFPSAPEQSEP